MSYDITGNLGVTFKSDKERKEFFSDRKRNHEELQHEINIPFRVDYSVFSKSPAERLQLANEKLHCQNC